MPRRPNILLIQADQLSASALPCYGNKITVTPTINRLADEGIVFAESYCNFPLCAPSRFSMMSGRLASRIRAYDNGAEFPSEIPTFAHYLRALGYRTCLSGKMHFVGADQLHGFDERLTSDIYPGDFAWAADWGTGKQRDTNGPILLEVAGKCENSVQIDYDEQVTERACRWLTARSGDHDPFLLTVSFTHPHDPYVCRQEDWALYDGVEIPLPTSAPATDPHSAILMGQYGLADVAVTEEQIIAARRGYYGSVSYTDRKIGQVLDALDAAGIRDDTIVIVTADHGDMLGEKGLWMKKVFYEGALGIPLLVHAPNRIGAARLGGLVSLVDLLPTMLGLAAADDAEAPAPVEPLDGIDLSPNILNERDAPNRPLYAELTCEGTPGPVLMIRRGPLKYIWSSVHPEMLFDVVADPQEDANLIGDTAQAENLAAFRMEVAAIWNADSLARDVRLAQVRRHLVQRAHHTTGTPPDWDYVESDTPDDRWMRGRTTYNDWAYGSITGLDT